MIGFETHGEVAVITLLNGRLNILTDQMHEQLYRTMQKFLRDPQLKVAVLTTPPGTSFSAGDDLKTLGPDHGDDPNWENLLMQLQRTKPVIAAVRGHCLAQGLVYLLGLTDIRFATNGAQFGIPEIKHGMGGANVVTRLSLHIPPTIAMRMALTGKALTATQALACNLINEIVSEETLLETAINEAQQIAKHSLPALRMEMAALGRYQDMSGAEALSLLSHLWDQTLWK